MITKTQTLIKRKIKLMDSWMKKENYPKVIQLSSEITKLFQKEENDKK